MPKKGKVGPRKPRKVELSPELEELRERLQAEHELEYESPLDQARLRAKDKQRSYPDKIYRQTDDS